MELFDLTFERPLALLIGAGIGTLVAHIKSRKEAQNG